MSTTILEPPIRVFKLSCDGQGSKHSDDKLRNQIYDLPKKQLPIFSDHPEFPQKLLKMGVHDTVNTIVTTIREPIAEIQEKRGFSRSQRYTFIDLMVNMFNLSYNACIAIITMLMGLVPLLEGMLGLLRFVLDKVLEINDTAGVIEKSMKIIVFIGELIVIFLFVTLILTVILMPVFHLIRYIFYRAWVIVNQ